MGPPGPLPQACRLFLKCGQQGALAKFGHFADFLVHKAVGLPAAQFDSFDSDEDADDPIEDEHHVIFACSGYVYARQLFPDLYSKTTSSWPLPEPTQSQSCSQVSHMG